MYRTKRRFGMAAWAGLALFCLLGPEARAQPITPAAPGRTAGGNNGFNTGVLGSGGIVPQPGGPGVGGPAIQPAPAGGTAALSPTYNPYTGTSTGAFVASPYYPIGGAGGVLENYGAGYGPFTSNPYLYNPYYDNYNRGFLYDPVNGYLTGSAALLSSYGQYTIQIQRAKQERLAAISAAIDVRRKLFDEARYELMHRPDPEKMRQRELERALDRARNDPPITEVWSAKALNDLYRHVATMQDTGRKGPNIPLDPDILKHINLTTEATRANPGLLKSDGKLQWPLVLQREEFKEPRTKLDRQLADAVQQVKFNNPVDATALRDMKAYHAQMQETLNQSIDELSPTEFIRADRYLRQVDNALAALEDPNLVKMFPSGKAKNVAELVDFMAKSGLSFAPAVPGDETAYKALYNALRAFDIGMAK